MASSGDAILSETKDLMPFVNGDEVVRFAQDDMTRLDSRFAG